MLPDKDLKFKGRFLNGKRTKGQLFAGNQLMYDGPIQNGKRHGLGVCMYNSEPEDCKYYNGKRTDAIYKQRIEISKQNKAMANQERKMEAMQKEIARLKSQPVSGHGTQTGNGINKLEECATMLLKKKACDQIGGFGGMACMALIPGGHNCF